MSAGLSPDQLLGSYVIERELGRGGMGAIYLGVHRSLGKRAAIKVLLPELSRREDAIARFWAEARAVTAIKHASIVDVYDHGTTPDGATFIVMEYLEGETLGARLKARGLLPIPQAIAITRQIANALAAAHAVGVVHRDLKPDNVFLVPDPEVAGGERAKLLDFGVAKLIAAETTTAQTITGALLGTPHYMSPEQCEGARAVDHRSDLYSLGCTLFQMVAGRLPFESPGVGGLIGMHLHVPPPKLRDRAPHASVHLERIVARLLAKQPDARYASAHEVAAALADPEASEVDAAAPVPLPSQAVTADLATAVSRFDERSVPPSEPALVANAPTELAPATQRPSTDTQGTIARTPRPRRPSGRTRWAWLAASVGMLGAVALAIGLGRHRDDAASERRRAPIVDTGPTRTNTGPRSGERTQVAFGKDRDRQQDPDGRDPDHAVPSVAGLIDALDRRDWLAAGTAARSLERTGMRREDVDRLLAPARAAAVRDIEREIKRLVAAGDCAGAQQDAMVFAAGWGPVAKPIVKLANECIDDGEEIESEVRDDVEEDYSEGRYLAAVARCEQRRTMRPALRLACVLAACAAKQPALARAWIKTLPKPEFGTAMEGCDRHGTPLLQTGAGD